MRWARHVALMGEERKCTGFWWKNPKEGDHSEDQGVEVRMGSEWILGILAGGVKWIQLAEVRDRLAGSCKCGDEPWGSGATELSFTFILSRSRVSSGSIVSDYGLDGRAIGVRSPAGGKDSSSSLCVQTGSGAHPAFLQMGTGGPFPGGKARPGRDADHSPPSSAEFVND
jgi:hypothetical protein